MEAVLGLVEHRRLRPLEDLLLDLLPAMGGQAVEDDGVRGGERHALAVDDVVLEGLPPDVDLVLLAHAGPDVGVDRVGSGHRLVWVAGDYGSALRNSSFPTPVRMTSFTATRVDAAVWLRWETVDERNNAGFTIERRTGHQWDAIGHTEADRVSTDRHFYEFLDASPPADVPLHYRLLQIDADGTVHACGEITVAAVPRARGMARVTVFPNPSAHDMSLRIELPVARRGSDAQGREVSLRIVDLAGRTVWDGTDPLRESLSFGESAGEVRDHLAWARSELLDRGIVAKPVDLALEAGFWAQLPGNFRWRPRPMAITSQNFLCFSPFHNFMTGKAAGNPWGPAVTVLRTASGTPLYFNFHASPAGEDSEGERLLGNTLILGQSSAGKTVLLGFLLAQAQKYRPTVVAFDKDRGLEIAIRAIPPVPVDAERLDIDSLPVHDRQSLRAENVASSAPRTALEGRALDDCLHLRNHAVAVHVDHFHAAVANEHLAALP